MPKRLLPLVVAVIVVVLAGCGPETGAVKQLAGQLARNEDDVARIVSREADRTGVPARDVESAWLDRLGRQGVREAIDSPAASQLCANLMGVLASTDDAPDRDVVLLKIALGNLASENPTAKHQLLADDIKETVAKAQKGEPYRLDLFFLRNFSCDLAGRAWQ